LVALDEIGDLTLSLVSLVRLADTLVVLVEHLHHVVDGLDDALPAS
jgi:hypothetical protein